MDRIGRYEIIDQVADDPPWRLYRARLLPGAHPYREGVPFVDSGGELILRVLNSLPADEVERQALCDGALALTYRHENIEQLIEWEPSGLYCVEPLVRGWKLHLLLDALFPIPWPAVWDIVQQVCQGLQALHTSAGPPGQPLGVAHGDIRPQTVTVTTAGVVQLRNPALSPRRAAPMAAALGSPPVYERLSPEQARGAPPSLASDIFQTGLLLDELLTGAPVFRRGPVYETLRAITSEPLPAPSARRADVPTPFDALVQRALAKEPTDRWPSITAFDDALAKVASDAGWEVAGRESLRLHLQAVEALLRPRIGGFL